MENQRLEIAARILAGFASNNAVFAHNGMCGWSLVNCTDEDIVGYSLSLADKLVEGEKITAERKTTADAREAHEWNIGAMDRNHP